MEIGWRTSTVSIDRLKPVLSPVLGPQQPPQHGRHPRAHPQSRTPVLGSVPAPGPVLRAEPTPVRRNLVRLTRQVLSTPPSIPLAPCLPRR